MRNWIPKFACAVFAASWLTATGAALAADVKILNVSYDVTREFYQAVNQAFTASAISDWKAACVRRWRFTTRARK